MDVLKSLYSVAAATVLLMLVPVALITYAVDSTHAAYIISKYPAYKYVLSSIAAPETVAAVLAASGAVLILSWFVVEVRYVLYALGTVFVLYTMNVLSLIVENEFFTCGCGLFYQTGHASTNLAIGLLLVAVNASLIAPLRGRASGTVFGMVTAAIPRGERDAT